MCSSDEFLFKICVDDNIIPERHISDRRHLSNCDLSKIYETSPHVGVTFNFIHNNE